MKTRSFAAAAFLAAGLFSACGDNSPSAPSGSALVGEWKVTAGVVNPPVTFPGVGTFTDIYNSPLYPECRKDDILSIRSDGTYAVSEGAQQCSPPGTESGTWKLEGNKFIRTSGGVSDTVTISISGNTVNATAQIESPLIPDGQPRDLTLTYTRLP